MIKIFNFINYSNKYFDENEPWILAKTNKEECEKILFNCVNIIFNINIFLKPYLPFSTIKVENYLNETNNRWEYKPIPKVDINKDIKPIYERYDKSKIEEERNNYKNA